MDACDIRSITLTLSAAGVGQAVVVSHGKQAVVAAALHCALSCLLQTSMHACPGPARTALDFQLQHASTSRTQTTAAQGVPARALHLLTAVHTLIFVAAPVSACASTESAAVVFTGFGDVPTAWQPNQPTRTGFSSANRCPTRL